MTSLAVRLRASHSPFGTGITDGMLPDGTSSGMSPRRPKRRASIQRVPCSHSNEKRRSYIKAFTNTESRSPVVTGAAVARFPEFVRTLLRSAIAWALLPANHCASASSRISSSSLMIGIGWLASAAQLTAPGCVQLMNTANLSSPGIGILPSSANCVSAAGTIRSEEHTSELQSLTNLVCRLLLEKKKQPYRQQSAATTHSLLWAS